MHQSHAYFWGAQESCTHSIPPRMDFMTSLSTQPTASWALVNVQTPDNGKGIATALSLGPLHAVSDGSYKDDLGSAAWKITTEESTTWIKGCTTIPGQPFEQCAYRSELGGIYSTVLLLNTVCQYYHLTSGTVIFGCDGLGPLHCCFHQWQEPTPVTPHYDLIKAIRHELQQSPLEWKWRHIYGHQDTAAEEVVLDQWALLNIEMDTAAKAWLRVLQIRGHHPTSAYIPGEGWNIWSSGHKFTSMSREVFDNKIQKRYSQAYWCQETKLGNAFDYIDWNICGDYRKTVSINRRIWMTKWVTGWLPIGKNMSRWKLWMSDKCPECGSPETSTNHILFCPAPERQRFLAEKIQQLEPHLLGKRLSPTAVGLLLGVLFPQAHSYPNRTVTELVELKHWQRIFGQMPHAWGFLHNSWRSALQQFPPAHSIYKHSPRRWLTAFLSQLWNTAWDLWGYRNGIIHNSECDKKGDTIREQVKQEYAQGVEQLPCSAWHWFSSPLSTLLTKPLDYLQAWLLSVQAHRQLTLE